MLDALEKGRCHSHAYLLKERAEIGKMAVNIGASAAARRFSKQSVYTVNKSLACRFKQLYLKESRAKRLREEEDSTISILPLKKQVDFLISKNQVLQIIYLKHHVHETLYYIIMDKKPDEIH